MLGEERKGFGYVVLRPGLLSDDAESGKVVLGKTGIEGKITRGDVAEAALRLLEKEGAKGWFDLLGAKEGEGGDVKSEVEKAVREGTDTREGESLEEMKKRVNVN